MSQSTHAKKYTGNLKKNAPSLPAVALVPGDQSDPNLPAGDQSDTSPEGTSGDQKATASKEKKISEQVTKWRAQAKFAPDWVITNVGENKKRGKAKDRFALYREGMTVAEYQQVFIDKKVGTRALATADMRWDHVAGFVTIVPPLAKEEPNIPAENSGESA
jgi:hypothetical protein